MQGRCRRTLPPGRLARAHRSRVLRATHRERKLRRRRTARSQRRRGCRLSKPKHAPKSDSVVGAAEPSRVSQPLSVSDESDTRPIHRRRAIALTPSVLLRTMQLPARRSPTQRPSPSRGAVHAFVFDCSPAHIATPHQGNKRPCRDLVGVGVLDPGSQPTPASRIIRPLAATT